MLKLSLLLSILEAVRNVNGLTWLWFNTEARIAAETSDSFDLKF